MKFETNCLKVFSKSLLLIVVTQNRIMFSPSKTKQGMGPVSRSKRRSSGVDPSGKGKIGFKLHRNTIKGICLFCICALFMILIYCVSIRETTDTPIEENAKRNISPERPLAGNINTENSQGTNQNILNVAIAIPLTKDPGTKAGFLDSITALSVSIDEAQSRHSITKVALVHESVIECLPMLWHFGFEVISKDIPINIDEIQNAHYVEQLLNSGCCGPSELLKLHIWTWTQYDYVIMMDADMHFHQNFDHLFDAISLGNIPNAKTKNNAEYKGKYLAWTEGASAYRKEV